MPRDTQSKSICRGAERLSIFYLQTPKVAEVKQHPGLALMLALFVATVCTVEAILLAIRIQVLPNVCHRKVKGVDNVAMPGIPSDSSFQGLAIDHLKGGGVADDLRGMFNSGTVFSCSSYCDPHLELRDICMRRHHAKLPAFGSTGMNMLLCVEVWVSNP